MNRRKFLASSISAALGLSSCGGGSGGSSGNSGGVTDNTDFTQTYFIPDELTGTLVGGRLQYNLILQSGTTQFSSGVNTPTWGINGNYLGPTIRLRNGDQVDLNFNNTLSESTTMHGHGMHVPANMDGGVHQVINAGATWTSSYTVNQHACTNWYHPHMKGVTADHVINGLAGLIIIDDVDSDALDLPKRYGIDDIPVIVQDRSFNEDGSFDYNPTMREIMRGWKGDTFMVNGVINPLLNVEAKQVRFRILNGSNSRVYTFAFASGKAFKQIASDNAFLEAPVSLTQLQLSPAERAEIVVDFSGDLGNEEVFTDIASGNNLFKVNVSKVATAITTLPAQLITLAKLNQANAVNTRIFALSGGMGQLRINGVTMDLNFINETVPLDVVEIWEVTSNMNMVHNFHIHATHFQIIERNGSAANVPANEQGFKDTVYLPPNETVKFIVKMVDYSSASTPDNAYMYHCHILEHEDAGMMGQFVVV
jgi:FtsP/CotA-like multicopper oxidase with cupredoxin domain